MTAFDASVTTFTLQTGKVFLAIIVRFEPIGETLEGFAP